LELQQLQFSVRRTFVFRGGVQPLTVEAASAYESELEISLSSWHYSDEEEWAFWGAELNGMDISEENIVLSPSSPMKAYENGLSDYPECEVTAEYTDENGEIYTTVCNTMLYVRGDANLDGVLDMRDASAIQSYMMGNSSALKDTIAADINQDGKVNLFDLIFITKTIANELASQIGGEAIERDTHEYAKLDIGDVAGLPGETVSVPINMTCNDKFASAAFIIEWDNTELTVETYESGEAKVSNGYGCTGEGYCTVANYLSYYGDIGASVDFIIPENAAANTEYELRITAIKEFNEYNGENLADTVSVSGGSISVLPGYPEFEETISMYEDEAYEFTDEFDVCEIVSSDETVAEVANNVISAVSVGETQIEYYVNEFLVGTSNLLIKDLDEFEVGINQQKFIFTPEFPYDNVEWEISNPDVAVIEDGILTGLSEGTAVITCRINGDGEVCYKGVVTVVKDAVITTTATSQTTADTTTTTTTVSTTLTKVTTSLNDDGQIIGDANLDGVLDIRDAAVIVRYLAMQLQNPDLEIPENADYNCDGRIRVNDAAYIARNVANNFACNRNEARLERTGSSAAKIRIGNAEAVVGKTVSVPLNIECGNNFESGTFAIAWDSNELTMAQFTNEMIGDVNFQHVIGSGYCVISAYSNVAVSDGKIGTFEFIIPENAEIGDTYEIYFTDVETFAEFEGEDLADTVSVSGGIVTVIPDVYESITLHKGESFEFPAEYDIFEITVEDNTMLTVENNTLNAVSEGYIIITLETDVSLYTIPVRVLPEKEMELDLHDELEINLDNVYNSSIIRWTSSNTEIATVDHDGVVYGENRGTAIISAYNRETGELLYEGTVNVVNGQKYGENLYYELFDSDNDEIVDSVRIMDCEETAISVHIPAEIDGYPVNSISYDAFENCTELAEITADEDITCFGNETFANTAWFKNEQAENTFVVLNGILIDGHAFEGDTLEIPEGIKIIGAGSFDGCENLKSVTIPESVTVIGACAFGACANLKAITIPESVEKICSAAFYGCQLLESITIENPDCEIEWLFASTPPLEQLVVYGHSGSTAEEFAKNSEVYEMTFVALDGADTTTAATTKPVETTSTTVSTTAVSDTEADTTGTTTASETTIDTTNTTNTTATTVTTTTATGTTRPLGDANNDGKMTVADAAFIARTLAKRLTIDAVENPYADYNNDGKVSVADAAAIARYLAKAKK